MNIGLEEFHTEFLNDLQLHAHADGQFLETTFVERFCVHLEEAGELDTFHPAHYRAAKGMRVDGYGGDPLEGDRQLTLVIADFSTADELDTLNRDDIKAIFNRLENFLKASLSEEFLDRLEESSPGYGLAELIRGRASVIDRVRLILVSNRYLKTRAEGVPSCVIGGKPTTFEVWDLSRLHRMVMSGKGREDIEIDFRAEFGRGLPCLPAHLPDSDYQAFLIVIPGQMLASIYERWGARLLEANVRSFLQANIKVNKGIKRTIEGEPGMFLAYNNGITATADEVLVDTTGGVPTIVTIRNLQIVNGGQTTASIFNATKTADGRAGLPKVFVQMKLSVVGPALSIEIVPKISEYANSQTKVSAADFFSNHPYHVRMEEYSRRVSAPAAEGAFNQSKWFYERARGQYRNEQMGALKQKKFDQEYPKKQLFTKTDMAKYEAVWEGIPETVCRGAQHNFASYAERVGKVWTWDPDRFNEMHFKSIVAKAIIFREAEAMILKQPWYDGYRAQIVAYAIAKLSHDVAEMKRVVDFEGVWKRQAVGQPLFEALRVAADAVQRVIKEPAPGTGNMSEWAKKPACWTRVKGITIDYPSEFVASLLDPLEAKKQKTDAKKLRRADNGIEAQSLTCKLGGQFWAEALQFALTKKLLTHTQRGILETAAKYPRIVPSEPQSLKAIEALVALETDGFKHPALVKAP